MCTVPIWVTRTGVAWPASVPLPSCPLSLPPQAHTEAPPATTATAESQPAAMAVTWDTPVILTGTALLAVLPIPSSPALLWPQAHTVPSERSARLNPHPAAILVTPASPLTGAAVASTPVTVPRPSSPRGLSPQAHMGPSERRARL